MVQWIVNSFDWAPAPHLSLVLQCVQRKQVLWNTCWLATSRSRGYTVLEQETHVSLAGGRKFCYKRKCSP